MSRFLKFSIVSLYYVAWLCIVIAAIWLSLSLILFVIPDSHNEEYGLNYLPVAAGLLLFFPIARKVISLRTIHWVNIGVGIIGIATSFPMAIHMFRKSEALSRDARLPFGLDIFTAPTAGLGEALAGQLLVGVGAFASVVVLAGVTGINMKNKVGGWGLPRTSKKETLLNIIIMISIIVALRVMIIPIYPQQKSYEYRYAKHLVDSPSIWKYEISVPKGPPDTSQEALIASLNKLIRMEDLFMLFLNTLPFVTLGMSLVGLRMIRKKEGKCTQPGHSHVPVKRGEIDC